MKIIDNLPTKQKEKIADISDERGIGDGVWIYLSKPYADFDFDPFHPTRQIHEQTYTKCLGRVRRAQPITESDIEKYPHLKF